MVGAGVKVRLRLPAPPNIKQTKFSMIFSHIDKRLLKKQILIIKLNFSSKEGGNVVKKILMVESLLFLGAGASAGVGAGQKRTSSTTLLVEYSKLWKNHSLTI